jgi:hypothetical protein
VLPVHRQGWHAPPDRTSAEQPFLFWLNDDQDDLELYESWPHTAPDNGNATIDSLRDLEDVTRLQLEYEQLSTLDPARVRLRISWKENGGIPTLRLWRHARPQYNCTRNYLEETATGMAQLEEPYVNAIGVVGSGGLELPLSLWTDEERSNTNLCLLFEGVAPGAGELRFAFLDGDKTITASQPLHLEIRPMKTFYQRVGVAWPDELDNPWAYVSRPPVPELQAQPESMGEPFQRPWYETDDWIVWIHGWIPQDPDNFRRTMVFSFETIWKRLWHQGFRGRIIHFRWPTVKRHELFGLHTSEYRAYKSAPALLDFVETLPADKNVHVTTHSLGGVLLMEALKLGLAVDEALFQVSAVPAESFDRSESLVRPDMAGLDIPRDAQSMGHAGYLEKSDTPIYSFYNPADITWMGWNAAQKVTKPMASWSRRYVYTSQENTNNAKLNYWWLFSRPVDDHHEAMANVVPARSHALGGEGRVTGLVAETVNLHHPPFEFGSDHVAMWRWNPQKVLPYFNYILDVFNIPYNDAGLSGSGQ